MTYRVGTSWDAAKPYMSAKQAAAAAIKCGDAVCVWRRTRTHWELLIDRSMPSSGRGPLAEHVARVLLA
jgi:hypothetical protein